MPRTVPVIPGGEFSKADLRAARDAMVEADAVFAGNRMLAYLGPAMRWAAQEDLIPHNFVPDIRRRPRKAHARLPDAEMAAIWRACGGLGKGEAAKSFGRMVRFLLVTAQRRDDAASLRYGHILDGTWRQTTNKSDRPIVSSCRRWRWSCSVMAAHRITHSQGTSAS